MPNLVGLRYTTDIKGNDAYSGFRIVMVEQGSDTVPQGVVISQDPARGHGKLMEDQIIQIVVSSGPNLVEMPDIIGQTQDSAVQELATKGLNATCFTVVNDGSEAAGCVVSASEDAGSMVEVGTTIVLYIAGDVPADAPAGPEAPSDTGTPAGGDAAQGGVEYDTD